MTKRNTPSVRLLSNWTLKCERCREIAIHHHPIKLNIGRGGGGGAIPPMTPGGGGIPPGGLLKPIPGGGGGGAMPGFRPSSLNEN